MHANHTHTATWAHADNTAQVRRRVSESDEPIDTVGCLNERGRPHRTRGVHGRHRPVRPEQQGVARADIEPEVNRQISRNTVRGLDARRGIRIGDIGRWVRDRAVIERDPRAENTRVLRIDAAVPAPGRGARVETRKLILTQHRIIEIKNNATRCIAFDCLRTRSLDLSGQSLGGSRYLIVAYEVKTHRNRRSRRNGNDANDHQKLDECKSAGRRSQFRRHGAYLLLSLVRENGAYHRLRRQSQPLAEC